MDNICDKCDTLLAVRVSLPENVKPNQDLKLRKFEPFWYCESCNNQTKLKSGTRLGGVPEKIEAVDFSHMIGYPPLPVTRQYICSQGCEGEEATIYIDAKTGSRKVYYICNGCKETILVGDGH